MSHSSSNESLEGLDLSRVQNIHNRLSKVDYDDEEETDRGTASRLESQPDETKPEEQKPEETGRSSVMEEDIENNNIISDFGDIGWKDPFPERLRKKKSKKKKKAKRQSLLKIDELVYDEAKMNPDIPPRMIFVPSEEIMMKMMRVCVECKAPSELKPIFLINPQKFDQ